MTMDLTSHCVAELPPLAWLASLKKCTASVELLCGRGVELFPAGFFEGAWAGSFVDGDFDRASNVFGSGARIGPECVTFVGPSHTLEPLYIAQTDRLNAVSNSLAFLLQHCGLRFDLRNFRYGAAFSAIVHGLAHTPQKIALTGGGLTLLYHHNAILSPDGVLTVAAKPLPPRFQAYDDYYSYLRGVTARVFENAEDSARRCRYRPISTMSSGYDSAAAAAVARACGCIEAVSLSTSSMGKPDSGRDVAEALGLQHTEFERISSGHGVDLAEAEFLATGMQGEDLVYSVFEGKLAARILVTGFQGGKIWGKKTPPGPSVEREDISGCSLGEFRLRSNFLHLPLPFIGIQRGPDVYRISNSPEMSPFTVGGNYDRPIPRRILEQAGVARSSFGQAKKGASILLFQGRSRMSRTAERSIASFARQQDPHFLLVLYIRTLWWTMGKVCHGAVRRIGRFANISRRGALARMMARVCASLFGIEAPVFGASHPRFTVILMWANSRMAERYAAAQCHRST